MTIAIGSRRLREIQREFIAAYIKGYSVIDLIGNHEGMVSEIRRRLHEIIGVEIMEVTTNRIQANVFFDISTISLPKIISRIGLITSTIMEETQAIVKNRKNLEMKYKELIEKKREVDRQSLFAIRIIVNALTDPSFASKIESDPLKLSFVWHLIEYMEKASDYFLSIAFYMTSTNLLEEVGKKGRDEFYEMFSAVHKSYEIALQSYNKNSVSLANKVFDLHTKNDRRLYSIHSRYRSRWVPVVTGYLRRTSSKSRDIAKITINITTK